MPQAPRHLQERWITDHAAFAQLGKRFAVSRGGIISPMPAVSPTPDDMSAIDYLCLEWDYGYDPGVLSKPPVQGRGS